MIRGTDRPSTKKFSRLRSKVAILALTIVAGAVVTGAGMAASAAPGSASGDWSTFGGTVDQNRHSPLTTSRRPTSAQLGPGLLGRLREARPHDQEGPAVVPPDRQRHALRDDGRRPRVRARRGHRRGQVAVGAGQPRRLQELRRRREPRRRLLRRQRLPRDARHAPRRARRRHRQAHPAGRDVGRRAERDGRTSATRRRARPSATTTCC